MAVSAGTVEYRAYRPGDERAINDGFNEVFGQTRSLEEWQWKFPASRDGRAIVVATNASGRVLAHYGAIVVPFQAQGLVGAAAQIVDIYSRPDARPGLAAARVFRETIRKFLTEFCRADRIVVAYGFPGARHMSLVRLGVASLGEAEMPPVRVRVWTRPAARRGLLWPRHEVSVGFDAGAVDDLWRRAGGRYPVAMVRDAARIGTRFMGRPGVEYVHLGVRRRGVVHAWAVVRSEPRLTSVADLVWDGDDVRALAALDRAVGRLACRAGADRAEMWLAGDARAEQALASLGWRGGVRPDGLEMAAYTFHPDLDVATFPDEFYLTMADSDLV